MYVYTYNNGKYASCMYIRNDFSGIGPPMLAHRSNGVDLHVHLCLFALEVYRTFQMCSNNMQQRANVFKHMQINFLMAN